MPFTSDLMGRQFDGGSVTDVKLEKSKSGEPFFVVLSIFDIDFNEITGSYIIDLGRFGLKYEVKFPICF